MLLEKIEIQNLRCIAATSLDSCGQFNVLIGKNNAGKSAILSAINIFFACIDDGNLASMTMPIGRAIDFHKKDTTKPIRIAIVFKLSAREKSDLIVEMATEAPQMKNILDSIGDNAKLRLEVSVLHEPSMFGYVSNIQLIEPTFSREIVSINDSSAREIHARLAKTRAIDRDIELLSSLKSQANPDLLKRWKTDPARIRYDIFGVNPSSVSRQFLEDIIALITKVTGYEEFVAGIKNMESKFEGESAQNQNSIFTNKISTFTGVQERIPNYVLYITRLLDSMKVLNLTERRKLIGEEEAAKLLRLKVTRGGPEVLRSIQETVSALIGVKVDAFRGGEAPRRTRTGEDAAELDVDNFLIEVNGSGIREALRVILDYEFEKPSILLVEEPELHLHPALETSMMRYLKQISADCQVFITTHSTNFLDNGEMRNVYLISKKEASTAQHVNYEEAESLIPSELGIRLSSLFMFDRFVFVEGPSDESIIRELASVLGINLGQGNVGFVPMGGVRNFGYYATEHVLRFLARRRVTLIFVIDRDERSVEDIRRLQSRLGAQAIVHVLKRREIENYLLVPRAIRELLYNKLDPAKRATLPELSAIASLIYQKADGMKDVVASKQLVKEFCEPLILSRELAVENCNVDAAKSHIKSEIDRLIEALVKRKQQLEDKPDPVIEGWDKNKLDLVPGDLLLDEVFKNFDLRFKKERDGVRLAALMKEGEIDREILDLIKIIPKVD